MPEIGQYASARFSHFECTDARFSGRGGAFGYERFVGSNGRSISQAGAQLPIMIGRSVSLRSLL